MADETPGILDRVVELLARAMDALGLNGTRLRWRWNRRRRDLGEGVLRAQMVVRSTRGTYKMCPSCRALVPRGARTCSECGALLSTVRAPGVSRVLSNLIPGTTAATFVILAVNTIMLAAVILLPYTAPGEPTRSLLSRLFSFDTFTLVRFGSGLAALTVVNHEWWRIITPIFLHAGLLHYAMNSWVLVQLGPLVEEEFGTERMAALYVACGIAGSATSQMLRPVHTVGASGALVGLIGVLLVHGYKIGGAYGRRLRSAMLQTIVLMVVISLLPGVDLLNHFGGLVVGCVMGYVTPSGPFRSRATETLWVALAWGAVALCLAAFAMMAFRGMHDATLVWNAMQGR